MPPRDAGGPWPQEWIDLLKRWQNENFPKLELATRGQYAAQLQGTQISLKAQGQKINRDDEIWLEWRSETDARREYVLYRKPGDGAQVGGTYFVEEVFERSTLTELYVLDASGPIAVAVGS
jgi:hypothetical protein